jgi:hypothetical protein
MLLLSPILILGMLVVRASSVGVLPFCAAQ